MFESGPHRFKLIEWIFTKLEFTIPISNDQLPEEKIEIFVSLLSSLGICKDSNVIKGLSSVETQISFWKTFVDILWMKHVSQQMKIEQTQTGETSVSRDESNHSDENFPEPYSMEHNSCAEDISKIIQAGYLKQIKDDVQIFPPFLIQESNYVPQEMLKQFDVLNLKNLKKKSKESIPAEKTNFPKQLPFKQYKLDDVLPHEELKFKADEINKTLSEFHICASKDFSNSHNTLKVSVSQATSDDFVDLGPVFQNVEPHLVSVAKLNKSLHGLKASSLKLNNVLDEADNFQQAEELLSDELLSQLLAFTTMKLASNHKVISRDTGAPEINSLDKHLVCQICGRWCSSKSSLLTHLRVHTGEKPFACDVCGKNFTQKATLQRHRHLHTGEKHFKCDFCSKRFYRKDKLLEHLHVHR